MSDMVRAYNLAAAAVRERLALQRPGRLELLNAISSRDVVVYSGSYDSVQHVLERLKVPFQLDPSPSKLSDAKIVFANCSSDANPTLRRRAEAFVLKGGWLVSTDWSLANVVERCFPNTVGRKQGMNSNDEVVAVEPELDSLWSDIVVLGADPQWWLESASYPIDILDNEKVRIEAASHELMVRYDAPAVAVRFDWGEGHVYHVISHLWLKRTRTPSQPRYAEPCTGFLRDGMRLPDECIEKLLADSRSRESDFNFATLQSAATSSELVAQLCIEAM
jgi:hypothetical protein